MRRFYLVYIATMLLACKLHCQNIVVTYDIKLEVPESLETQNSDVKNLNNSGTEKFRQLYFINGKERKETATITAGDIGVSMKLKDTHTGDSLAYQSKQVMLTPITYPSACMHLAVSPSSRGDGEKLAIHYSKMIGKHGNNVRHCWWHSHHTMGAFWSGTDDVQTCCGDSRRLCIVL